MKALVTIEGKTAAVQEVPVPTPGEGEILIKVHYAAQNPTDWKSMKAVPPGRILGCDFAGTVADSNGSKWRENQRVAGWVFGASDKPLRGAYAEYLVTESSLVFPVADAMADADAAVVPLAFATAVQAMYQRLGLPEPSKPAKSATPFLVNGGTSSVGQYAVQLAKLSGLFVIATGSRRNHEFLRDLGADAVVDYNDDDWIEQVRALSHDGLLHAFDCISEKATTAAVARTLSPTKGGHVLTILPRKPDELPEGLNKVRVESTIAYTVFGRPIRYGTFDNCGEPTPDDKAMWEKYLAMLPEYLGDKKIRPNKPRELDGGLDAVLGGFQLHEEGKVSAEKLVYKLA